MSYWVVKNKDTQHYMCEYGHVDGMWTDDISKRRHFMSRCEAMSALVTYMIWCTQFRWSGDAPDVRHIVLVRVGK